MRRPASSWLCVVSILLAAASASAQTPPAPRDPAELVPVDALAFAGWSGVIDENNELLQLAQAVVSSPFFTNEMSRDAIAAGEILHLIELAGRQTGALAVLSREGGFDVGLVLDMGSGASEFAKRLDTLLGGMFGDNRASFTVGGVKVDCGGSADEPRACWTRSGDVLLMSTSRASIEKLLAFAGSSGGRSLAQTEEYAFARRKADLVPARTGCVFYATKGAIDQLIEAIRADDQSAGEVVKKIADALGITAVQSLVVGADHGPAGARVSSFAHYPQGGIGRQLYDQKPVTDDDLKIVPRDAYMATVWNLDLEALHKSLREQLKQSDPAAAGMFDGFLTFASGFVGFSLADELIPALGDTWSVLDAPSHGGVFFTGVVLVAEVRDEARLRDVIARLVKTGVNLARGAKVGIVQKQATIDGRTVEYLLVRGLPVPVAFAWSFVGQRCVVGLFPQTVAAAARQIDPATRGESLLDHPDFRAARPQLGKNSTSIGYLDCRYSYRVWYTVKQLAHTAAAALSVDAPAPHDLATFPTFAADLQDVRNLVWAYSVDDEGVRYVALGGTPGMLLIGGDASGVATTALSLSILLPSLSRARELAKRAVSGANLRGIGQGCHIYASENDGKFPPSLNHLVESGVLTEKMLVSPRGDGQQPYVYVAGLQSHPKLKAGEEELHPSKIVLAYENIVDDEGTNVLWLDAHVEWIKLDDFKRRLHQTYVALGREAELPPELRP